MPAVTEQGWSQDSGTGDTVNLLVQRCTKCDQLLFPPTAERCSRCWSSDLTVEECAATGSVYSYTVVRRSFPGLETPYIVGLIDLDGGLRIMARVAADESQLAVGGRVVAQAGAVHPGMPAMTYQFRLAD